MAEHDKKKTQFFEHQDYISWKDDWRTISEFLEGNHACLTKAKYLWLHASEGTSKQCDSRITISGAEDRQRREQRTQYVNYLKMVLQRFVSLIMKGGINDSEVLDVLGENAKNVDLLGANLHTFVRSVAEDLIGYGIAYILTDTVGGYVESLKDEQLGVNRPFWKRIPPLEVKDWITDDLYQVVAIRHENTVDNMRGFADMPVTHEVSYNRSWDGFNYLVQEYVSQDENYLSRNVYSGCKEKKQHFTWTLQKETIVPIEDFPVSTRPKAESWLKDVIPIVLKIFNKQSEKDNVIHNQGYEKIFIIANIGGALDVNNQVLADEAHSLELTVNTVTVLPENSQVVKLEVANTDGLREDIAADIMDLYRVAFNMTRMVQPTSSIAESAESRREAKEDLLTRIETKRIELLDIVNGAINHWAMVSGYKGEVGKLSFNRKVDELDLMELAEAVRAFAGRFELYPDVNKAVDKKLVGMMNLPNNDELQEIMDSTDLEQVEMDKAKQELELAASQIVDVKK